MMDRDIELLTAEEPIVTSEVLAAFILVRYNYQHDFEGFTEEMVDLYYKMMDIVKEQIVKKLLNGKELEELEQRMIIDLINRVEERFNVQKEFDIVMQAQLEVCDEFRHSITIPEISEDTLEKLLRLLQE